MTDHSHHGEHEHHRFQAHHFDSGEQQFQAGKLGMWLFLATEVLFFSGMFCAYAVFRAHHPEIFEDASKHLDTYLGAANTLVLLASSLTVAWAVRCAQLNQKAGIVYNLVFTLICAGIFMGVKAVEYSLKFKEGLLWRSRYTFEKGSHPDLTDVHAGLQNFGLIALAVAVALIVLGYLLGGESAAKRWTFWALGATVLGVGGGALAGNAWTLYQEQQKAAAHAHDDDHADEPATIVLAAPVPFEGEGKYFPGMFFSIYYAMTGVHAIHILGGIGVIVWIVSRAAAGHFEPEYYGPVEYVGLYWHLVDLIWIYLFPLLYLI